MNGPSPALRAPSKLLIVDDEPTMANQLKWGLGGEYDVLVAGDPEEAWDLARRERPDVVTLDLSLRPGDDEGGFSLLGRFLELDPAMKVVLVTGNDSRDAALKAVERGAFDFFTKPVDLDELRILLRRASALRHLELENASLKERLGETESLGRMLGRSREMHELFQLIRRVAGADVTVLVTGESGTGKELAARELHRLSGRSGGPFVSLSCGAIPESLLESELFGHEKGAFTSAHRTRPGKVETAEGGTLFLDEIGEMPPALQVKILRFLQEREIERVGGRKTIPVDVRIIAATHRDLKEEVANGRFREDLFFRLSVVNVALPPLRARREDVAYLAQIFLARYAAEYRRGRVTFSRDAIRALQHHPWPGNVRELEHAVQRVVVLSTGRVIHARDLDLDGESAQGFVPLRAARDEAERRTVEEALRRTCGNIARAAKELEVSRPTLHDLLRKHAIQASRFKDGMGPRAENGSTA